MLSLYSSSVLTLSAFSLPPLISLVLSLRPSLLLAFTLSVISYYLHLLIHTFLMS